MKCRTISKLAFIAGLIAAQHAWSQPPDRTARATDPQVKVCLDPEEHCADRVIEHFALARRSILLRAASITSQAIADGLVDANRRGLEVRTLLDAELADDPASRATDLAERGVAVWLDDIHTFDRAAFAVLDRALILSGESVAGDRDADRAGYLLLISGAHETARRLSADWHIHRGHARKIEAAKALPVNPLAKSLVYVTPSGRKYHSRDCAHARNSGQPIPRQDARKKGKTACSVCRPDDPKDSRPADKAKRKSP